MYKTYSYKKALKLLYKISMFGSKPGLSRIKKLLKLFNNPQKNLKTILVTGTNGKGSTTYFISKILLDAGYKVGTFISPPIFSIRERIQLNLKYISKKDFGRLFFQVYNKSKKNKINLTFFEILTSMAILYFHQKKIDWAVFEIGMGGRLDATNVNNPKISIITSIGHDHTKHLGSTYKQIAFEKCSIFRKDAYALIPQNISALYWIKKFAKEKKAKLIVVKVKRFNYPNFQHSNISLSLEVARLLNINTKKAYNSIKNFKLKARWEKIATKPKIIIDCAHNPPAAKAILPMLKKDFKNPKNNILVYASMKDKDYKKILKIILPFFDRIVFSSPLIHRAEDPFVLKSISKKIYPHKLYLVEKNPKKAFLLAKKLAKKNGNVLIVGSIYLLQALFAKEKFFVSG
mgnify:CR=1 FL=1